MLGDGSPRPAMCEDMHVDLAGTCQSARAVLQSAGPATAEEIGNFDGHVARRRESGIRI